MPGVEADGAGDCESGSGDAVLAGDGWDKKFVVVLRKQNISMHTLLKSIIELLPMFNCIPNKTHDIKERPR